MALRIKLILSQHGGVPTRFQLGAGILQGFFGVFQDMVSILAVAVMGGEISSRILRLSGTTGINDEGFPMFDRYSESHENHLFPAPCSTRTSWIHRPSDGPRQPSTALEPCLRARWL